MDQAGEITQLLQAGDKQSLEKLLPIVYDELRAVASRVFRGEFRENHTLQPTALVHEAFLRLVGDLDRISWKDRAHFFGIAARLMRQVLVNHAIANKREKRGGGQSMVALDDAISFFQTQNIDILTLYEALERLEDLDKRQAEIVELRFFGGLTIEEVSELLDISPATVKRDWEMARIWLFRELKTIQN
ncbi:MAG TPA: sigma-70 family RNA polymerase sigma factor [Pyrinomonadaceae bacterium]|nr:sigma-70 family RNA polymerase sigma factor [Acidobacteriota bacterium]HQZ97958.1 sigma-70 family RNA polymerase sigma factor [Pyrinomonadaceae bacterium]